MRIIVTGGAGFIGSHMVDRLIADGHTVTVVDDLSSGKRENVHVQANLVLGNVADSGLMIPLAGHADAIVHLAAIASVEICEQQPERAYETNVAGTEVVFAAAAAHGIPVIYASSAAVYGDNPNLPLTEDAEPAPLGAYGRHKLACERIAGMFDGVPSVGVRLFNVYGPRQDPHSPYSGVISKFVANARNHIPLTLFGDGTQTRDFIYVEDVVALLLTTLKQVQGVQVVNGATGQAISLQQLATAVADAVGHPVTTGHGPARQGDIRHSLGNPALAHTLFGFTAHTPLTKGLKALAASLG